MNTKVKKAWLEYLRSGKFDQYQGGLRDPECQTGYCCLGVLCEVHRKLTKKGAWDAEGNYKIEGTADVGFDLLPSTVTEWAGLDSCDPTLGAYTCSSLNDGVCGDREIKVRTFEQIADLIEKQL